MPEQNTHRGRYVGEVCENGDVLLYDTENEDAWIRSDTVLELYWQD